MSNEEMTHAVSHQEGADQIDLNSLDLHAYSVDDLDLLIKRAQATIRGMRLNQLNQLRREVQKAAEFLGMSVAEVVGLEKPARRGPSASKVAPKYRNPDNPEQTWTGRGQKPVWLRELLEQGFSLDDFLIS